MESEGKFWIGIFTIITIGIITITLGMQYLYNQRIQNYVDNGYTQKTLPGEMRCQWVKN